MAWPHRRKAVWLPLESDCPLGETAKPARLLVSRLGVEAA